MVRPGFNWNRQGYYKFMQSIAPAIAAGMGEIGEEIADDANRKVLGGFGDDFAVDVELVAGRRKVPRVGIVAQTFAGNRAEQSGRALTRAVEAKRG
jgi:hypothetical protein